MDSSNGVDTPRTEPVESLLARLRRQTSDGGFSGGESNSPTHGTFQPFNPQQQQFQQRLASPMTTPRAASLPLGPRRNTSPRSSDPLTGYRPATVSSPVQSPQPTGPQPRHASAVMSPVGMTLTTASPGLRMPAPSSDRTSNLLNLLKFAQPASTPPAQAAPASSTDIQQSTQQEAGDVRGQAEDVPSQDRPEDSRSRMAEASVTDPQTQDLLLRLLSQARPSREVDAPTRSPAPERSSPAPLSAEQAAVDGLARGLADTALEDRIPAEPKHAEEERHRERGAEKQNRRDRRAEARAHRKGTPGATPPSRQKDPRTVFTYVSPFGTGARSRAGRPGSSGSPAAAATVAAAPPPPAYNILKRPGSAVAEGLGAGDAKRRSKESSPEPAHVAARRKMGTPNEEGVLDTSDRRPSPSASARGRIETSTTQTAPATKSPETVAEAVGEVGAQVSRQVQEALAKADRSGEAADVVAEPGKGESESEHEDSGDQEDAQGAAGDERLEAAERNILGASTEVALETVATTTDGKETADANSTGMTNGDRSPHLATSDVAQNHSVREGKHPVRTDSEGEDRAADEDGSVVHVHNFPMKPFTCLTIDPTKKIAIPLRPDRVLAIARFKKEADPADETVVAVSKEWITYAMVKHGGFRIIRQDDGRDKQVFGGSEDRITNVLCSMGPSGSLSDDGAAVFGMGSSSSVYWADMSGVDEQAWATEDLESSGLIFPPHLPRDEGLDTGHPDTRVRKSSRHPRFFALGRGKAIYVVWPSVAQNPRFLQDPERRVVDTTKYLSERCRKIATGKAGQEFAFSEDDTTIVSVDRVGRMKVWDIRRLLDEPKDGIGAPVVSKTAPIEIKTPMAAYTVRFPGESAAPCSIMFVDKLKPFGKGTAQRYLLLGMKRNHVLQLWDLALARAVQELRLPYDEDSNAQCSIAFHPASGTVVVGHPGRNSIYYLTLSSPRYAVQPMSQATYFECLGQRDPQLCKPDSTAIIVGLREYSLASKGRLRSLAILTHPASPAPDGEGAFLFELYVMHSKGVSRISVKPEDLGWVKDGRVLHPVDAIEEGLAELEVLRYQTLPLSMTDATSTQGDRDAFNEAPRKLGPGQGAGPSSARSVEATSTSKVSELPTPAQADQKSDAARETAGNKANEVAAAAILPDKAEKKKKRRAGAGDTAGRSNDDSVARTPLSAVGARPSQTGQRSKAQDLSAPSKDDAAPQTGRAGLLPASQPLGSPVKSSQQPTPAVADTPPNANVGISADTFEKEVRKIEKAVSTEFNKVISTEFNRLYRRVSDDQRIQQAAGDAKMDAVLRLVSSTLTENVEKALSRIILQGLRQAVVPAIKDVTATVCEEALTETLRDQLRQLVPAQVARSMPESVRKAMRDVDMPRAVSELVTEQVAGRVESAVVALVRSGLSPVLQQLQTVTLPEMASDMESSVARQIDRLEGRAQGDSEKIENLQELVHGLTRTVSRMASVQAEFQQEILKLQRRGRDEGEPDEPRGQTPGGSRQQRPPQQQAQAQAQAQSQPKRQSNRAASSRTTSTQANAAASRPAVQPPPPQPSAEPGRSQPVASDLEATAALMRRGNYEAAFIKVRSTTATVTAATVF